MNAMWQQPTVYYATFLWDHNRFAFALSHHRDSQVNLKLQPGYTNFFVCISRAAALCSCDFTQETPLSLSDRSRLGTLVLSPRECIV